MAEKPQKRRRPRKKRAPAGQPAPTAGEQLQGGHNKAHDLLQDDAASLAGWMGRGFTAPPGPPWPWDALLPDERAVFDTAVARLRLVLVPEAVALNMCWGEGHWRAVCDKIIAAQDVRVYPSRHHITLVPRPTIRQLLGLPPGPRPS